MRHQGVSIEYAFGLLFIGVLRQMQRYFSHLCEGTDVQADWRRSLTYGRAPDAIAPREGPGGLSRECVLSIPSLIVKGDKMGRCVGITI